MFSMYHGTKTSGYALILVLLKNPGFGTSRCQMFTPKPPPIPARPLALKTLPYPFSNLPAQLPASPARHNSPKYVHPAIQFPLNLQQRRHCLDTPRSSSVGAQPTRGCRLDHRLAPSTLSVVIAGDAHVGMDKGIGL